MSYRSKAKWSRGEQVGRVEASLSVRYDILRLEMLVEKQAVCCVYFRFRSEEHDVLRTVVAD